MIATGYADTFNRTVSGGMGTATSGQVYTTANGTFSVAPSTATCAMTTTANMLAYVDRQTVDIDITAQVALTAIPSTNLSVVGLSAKQSTNQNYYVASLKVVPGGAMAIRFSKVLAGSLITLGDITVSGTYVAGTFYNLRFQCYWSNALQTNILNAKLWAIGSTPPGGWSATTTDNAITQYTAGTQAGLYSRDEQTTPNNSAKWQNVAATTYGLPVPAATDGMCADPSVAYPKQTALQSLAAAADSTMAQFDSLSVLAGLFPRVRVSATNQVIPAGSTGFSPTWATTEFNVGTPTNLGYTPQYLTLGVGIWQIFFEIQLAEAPSQMLQLAINGWWTAARPNVYMRSNAAQTNDNGNGGSQHLSTMTWNLDPLSNIQISCSVFPNSTTQAYTILYCALTAIKISDYFV